jgi:hypothetical protein
MDTKDMNTKTHTGARTGALHAPMLAHATGAVLVLLRGCAFVLYLVMGLAEPFIGVVLCFIAFAAFFVAVLFGFILQMPFPQRWELLIFSVVTMIAYGAFLLIHDLLRRFINNEDQ